MPANTNQSNACPQCGTRYPTGARFCSGCGTPVTQARSYSSTADQEQSQTTPKSGIGVNRGAVRITSKTVAISTIAVFAIIGALIVTLLIIDFGEGAADESETVPVVAEGTPIPLTDSEAADSSAMEPTQELPSVNFDCEPVREIPHSECEALVTIFEGLGGALWGERSSWAGDHMPCGWSGVSCADGHVTGVELRPGGSMRSVSFQGPLPPDIEHLPHLRILDLSIPDDRPEGSVLAGEIPPEIGNLVHLRVLDLSRNRLSGGIPSELGNLRALESLALNGNQLTGSIPPDIGGLVNVDTVDLSSNRLDGSIPSEIGNLLNLEQLNLSNNDLAGELPQELSYLDRLERLNITENPNLSGPIPPTFTRMESLDARLVGFHFVEGTDLCEPRDNELQDFLDEVAGNRTVRLCDEAVAIPPPIPELDREFSCQNVGEIPIAECEALVALYNNANGPNWHAQMVSEWLILPRPCDWRNVRCTDGRVTNIQISFGGLDGPLPPEIGALEYLTELSLTYGRLYGPIPAEVGNLKRLENLNLAENELNGRIPPELGQLAQLETLNFFNNQLEGELPAELGQLESLRTLNVAGNQLEGPIPREITNLDLGVIEAGGSGLCEPPDPEFQAWRDGIHGRFPSVMCPGE